MAAGQSVSILGIHSKHLFVTQNVNILVKTKNVPMALKHKINLIFYVTLAFPSGNFSHLIRFCSERIPYCNTSSQTMNLRISEKKLTESNMFETFFQFLSISCRFEG